MTITLNDLDLLDKACNNMSILIHEIKGQVNPDNDKRKLFVSRADYCESLKEKKQIPQDFFYFRDFDVFIQLVYNKRIKRFQIYIEGHYCYLLNKFERCPNSDKSYILYTTFDESYKLYNDVLRDYLSTKMTHGLF